MGCEMKASAIIQARIGSTRLPGKVLLRIAGKAVLEHVVERARKATSIKEVVVATTVNSEDTPIAELAGRMGAGVYRGSENDVLDRYYQAAKLFKVKHIVRITADCPLIDPRIIDDVVNLYFNSRADYCSNTLIETFPDGEDVEVFGLDALNDSWKNAKLLSEREHVTPYIKKHTGMFRIETLKNAVNLSGKRWTLDEREDFEFIKMVLGQLYPANPDYSMEDVLKFLAKHPDIEKINGRIARNEGYLKPINERGI